MCGLWDLGSPNQATAVKALSPKHWTAREIPASFHIIFKITPWGTSHPARTREQALGSALGIHPGLHHILTAQPWPNVLTLCFSFLTHKMETLIVLLSWGC